MEIFFFLAVTAGLVIVLSGLGGEFDRKRRHERWGPVSTSCHSSSMCCTGDERGRYFPVRV